MQPKEIADLAVQHWEAIQGTLPINAAIEVRQNQELYDVVVHAYRPFAPTWRETISISSVMTRPIIQQDVELLHRLAAQWLRRS